MTIEEFVCRYFSLTQTALIDSLLYEDKHMELFNNLFNLHTYTVELSTGSFTGTMNQLLIKKAAIHKVLQQESNYILEKDIDVLETNKGIERTVYEWYAVPYWIARHMIDADEVVFSWKDCYWWGRCSIGDSILNDHSVKNLFGTLENKENP